MSPEFARAVDPIFLRVIGVVDRIERGETLVAEEEIVKIRKEFDNAEALLGVNPEWSLAKYALATWTDALLSETSWEDSDWWNSNALEVEFFRTREAYQEFYLKAREATTLPRKDALEVFFVCVMLGFRGMYTNQIVEESEHLNLPKDLMSWCKQSGMAIQLGKGRPSIVDKSKPGEGAPPLEGKFMMVGSSLLAVVLMAFTAIYFYSLYLKQIN